MNTRRNTHISIKNIISDPESTPEVTPESNPEFTPESTPEFTPGSTPEFTPGPPGFTQNFSPEFTSESIQSPLQSAIHKCAIWYVIFAPIFSRVLYVV